MSDSDSDTERDIIELQSALKPCLKREQKESWSSQVEKTEIYRRALEKNKKCIAALARLQHKIVIARSRCHKKLDRVRSLLSQSERTMMHANCLGYYRLGSPYFKDLCHFSSPPNDDLERVRKLGIETYPTRKISTWSAKEKNRFLKIILQLVRKKKSIECTFEIGRLKSKISLLKQSELSRDQEMVKALEIPLSYQEEKLGEINKLPLESLVLPLNVEEKFDWEYISHELGTFGQGMHTATECKNIWKLFLHPQIRKSPWNLDERNSLRTIARQNSFENWDEIAHILGTQRSAYQCFIFHTLYLKTHTNKWTPDEDDYLRNLVENCRIGNHIPWTKVAYYLETKTKFQCYNRWTYSISCKLKGRFKPEEDALILAGAKKGFNILTISRHLPCRKLLSVKNRYQTLRRGWFETGNFRWTLRRDKLLWNLVSPTKQTTDNVNFSALCKYFPTTTPLVLKKRYLVLQEWLKAGKNTLKNIPRHISNIKDPIIDFNTAVERVNALYEKNLTKGPRVNDRRHVNNIMSYFETQVSKADTPPISTWPSKISDLIELRNILLLLGAKLDKELADSPTFIKENPSLKQVVDNLLKLEENPPTTSTTQVKGIKTYSRKNKVTTLSLGENAVTRDPPTSIWNDTDRFVTPIKNSYVLPPSFDTCVAFRSVMLQKLNPASVVDQLDEGNNEMENAIQNFNHRFNVLFTWPANLSNIPPCLHATIFDINSDARVSCAHDNTMSGEVDNIVNVSRKRKAEMENLRPSKLLRREGAKWIEVNHQEEHDGKLQKAKGKNINNVKDQKVKKKVEEKSIDKEVRKEVGEKYGDKEVRKEVGEKSVDKEVRKKVGEKSVDKEARKKVILKTVNQKVKRKETKIKETKTKANETNIPKNNRKQSTRNREEKKMKNAGLMEVKQRIVKKKVTKRKH